MQTTRETDDDALESLAEMAREKQSSINQVLSDLIREAAACQAGTKMKSEEDSEKTMAELTGFRPFPSRGVTVTNEDINRLRESLNF
jgi:hypothetical protein